MLQHALDWLGRWWGWLAGGLTALAAVVGSLNTIGDWLGPQLDAWLRAIPAVRTSG